MVTGTHQDFAVFVMEQRLNFGEDQQTPTLKHCAEFRGIFRSHKALFRCNAGLGQQGQFVRIQDQRTSSGGGDSGHQLGLCEVEVFARPGLEFWTQK
jgi:hypothetical protein